MKHRHLLVYLALVFLCVWGGTSAFAEDADMNAYTKNTPIQAVIHDPAFGDYGRLIFPVDEGYMSGDTLGSLRLTWYNNIDPDKTVEIANFLRTRAERRNHLLRYLYRGRKSRRSRQAGFGLVLLQGYAGRAVRRVQRGRRLCLCGRDAGQLPARAGAFQEGLQRLCADLSPRRADGVRGFGTRHQLYL